MYHIPIDQIAKELGCTYQGPTEVYVQRVVFDSREVAQGDLFVAIRGQRDEQGERCLREWPTGVYQHTGLRGFYIGSNDLRKIDDTISTAIWTLDISDNPNITFDASDVCYAWENGAYILIYDKTQNITNCEAMLE